MDMLEKDIKYMMELLTSVEIDYTHVTINTPTVKLSFYPKAWKYTYFVEFEITRKYTHYNCFIFTFYDEVLKFFELLNDEKYIALIHIPIGQTLKTRYKISRELLSYETSFYEKVVEVLKTFYRSILSRLYHTNNIDRILDEIELSIPYIEKLKKEFERRSGLINKNVWNEFIKYYEKIKQLSDLSVLTAYAISNKL